MLSENTLFGVVDDCSICPFSYDNAKFYNSDYRCNGNPDYNLPCTRMDEFQDCTLEEVVATVNMDVYNQNQYHIEEYEKQQKQIAENKRRAELRKKTNSRNQDLNWEIKAIRKRIAKRLGAINSLKSLSSAFSITNAIFSGRNTDLEDERLEKAPQIMAWREANKIDEKRLKELLELRKQRNNENRRRTKDG